MIALLKGLKDLPGTSANTSFMDQKPTAELFTGWRLSDWTLHLSVKMNDLATPTGSHGANSTIRGVSETRWITQINSCRCRGWTEEFVFSCQTLESTCCSAGFTNFSWMFPSMFSMVSEFLCFLDLWSSVRIQQTSSRTVDVYSWQNYWFTVSLTRY